MKILLDECITKRLKPHLSAHEVYTVSEKGWNGIKNGNLLSLCVEHNFDILLTIDKNILFQQNPSKFKISIVVLNSLTSKLEELITFIPAFNKQIDNLEKYKVILIEK